jgi:cysteine desulfurase / selenocysteine lyase
MTLNINEIRENTAGIGNGIYLDNAGASLVPLQVMDAIKGHLDLESTVGGYVAQAQQSDRLENVYASLAKLFGGHASEYAMTSSAADAWGRAFYSVPMKSGDNVITAYNEYCSNYVALLHRAKRDGIEIRVARADDSYALDTDHLASLIDNNTKLIAISQVPSSSGQINPVVEVGKIARATGVLYLLDACQAIGQLPVNVDTIGCDMFAGTSRKFLRGPRGVGFMYVRASIMEKLDPVMMSNQSAVWTAASEMEVRCDARVFETWERSVALQLGFGAALDYLLSIDTDTAMKRTIEMADYLRQKLEGTPGVTIADPIGPRAAIVTFEIEGRDPNEVKTKLAEKNIAINVASVVHTRLDLEARGIESLLRASPQYYTLHEELDRFVDAMTSL